MKAIWKGAIGSGLVTIPMKLFGPLHESELDLHVLVGKDPAPSLVTEQRVQHMLPTARRSEPARTR